ncbi:hypothetical protein OIU84_014761 [Salix udensis]|uniref:Peroxidase n=1 Tax=Salix udensis TaxID=889485 RepID=A0AAD6NRV8_9ROSI|nr:hypothetical protein OIU84_014761 [Salix udensis]
MVSANFLGVFLLMELLAGGFRFGADGLSMNYYIFNCPFVEPIVRSTVASALQSDPTLAAALVRMHFHDCWIQGCDGSILLDTTKDNTAEKDSPGNLSVRGFKLIDDVKGKLESMCPGVVSCADIIAMAAREAVSWSGGPVYDIPKGKKRMEGGLKSRTLSNLPFPTFNASQLIGVFGQRGFSAQDMVALSGAHTLGVSRCSSFKSRLSDPVDPTMDSDFSKTLARTCRGGDNAEQPFDMTRNNFDSFYFQALQRKAGVLFSDQTLYNHPKTRAIVNNYAMNQAMFFLDFQQAMVKMSLLDVKEGSKGEVRADCRKVN